MGSAHDDLVSLPALTTSQPHRLGLDLNRIVAAVNSFKTGRDFHYRYVSHSNNCAGIARRALAAGSAAPFLRLGAAKGIGGIHIPPTAGRPYLTPNNMPGYAK